MNAQPLRPPTACVFHQDGVHVCTRFSSVGDLSASFALDVSVAIVTDRNERHPSKRAGTDVSVDPGQVLGSVTPTWP